jgi:4-amino-4-deoxy-L-arabinose transferase-like glycosyltransferase
MRLKVNIWFIYFITKIIYIFLALFVYKNMIPFLGDTEGYLAAEPFTLNGYPLNSTGIMYFLGGTFSFLFGKIFANVPFVIISFYGVFYPIKKINLSKYQLIFILFLLSFPNFGIWSSIASKEAVVVFAMGLILGCMIELIKGNSPNYLVLFIGVTLCYIFKFQYLIGITFALLFIIFHNKLRLKFNENLLFLIFIIFSSLLFLFIFKTEINELSLMIPVHFSLEAGSTRENQFFLEDYDIFRNAPKGMFIAFVGPTLDEGLNKSTHLLVFLESMIIISIFLFSSFKLLATSIIFGKFNIYYFGIFFIILFWLLFTHYPLGILNPGSAVRYRQGFYSFLVILYYFLYTSEIRGFYNSKIK